MVAIVNRIIIRHIITSSKINFRLYGSNKIRVRFAPSPTGSLHLGGLRTAFYNYLFAKKSGGSFVLRIEDTDQKRFKAGSFENIVSMLEWTSLVADESPVVGGPYGPYVQSQRLELYQEKARILVECGAAYRCFCSETRLELMRKDAQRQRHNRGYDNKCRSLSQSEIDQLLAEGKSFTIRFKIHNGPVSHSDIVYGQCSHDISENEGDFVILKSDGFPTYHFACVVDDHLMNITHVLRGVEWLVSTPKHLMLHHAFGWDAPKFAHLPLLVNSNRTKLSKRQETIGVEHYKNRGYSPEALLSFLAAAGGGFGKHDGCNVFDLNSLCEQFNLEELNTNSAVLDLKKLENFNHNYIAKQFLSQSSLDKLVMTLREMLKQKYGERYEDEKQYLSNSYIGDVLKCYKDRISSLSELLCTDMEYLWASTDWNSVAEKLHSANLFHLLPDVKAVLSLVSDIPEEEFSQNNLNAKLRQVCSDRKLPYAAFMQTMRIALTGQKDGPGVAEIIAMLGKERCLVKLRTVLDKMDSNQHATSSG